MTSSAPLRRRLGLSDAVLIGLGSMIGAGVFAAFTPAAQAAGNGLLVGLVVAAFVAFCNATSSAQLAAVYPTSGGTYVYGRERLGNWWGFLAGWSFVIGKTASCAAMALTFAAYAAPAGWERPIAVCAVLALTAVNLLGITRTAAVTRVIVVFVLVVLAIVVAAGASSAPFAPTGEWVSGGWYGVLQSAGLLFFAFAGYARIATLGEEVINPERTIPLAITISLCIVIVLYAVVGATLLLVLGANGVASTPTPLTSVVDASAVSWAAPLVRVAAAVASLGALLALIAGVSRTTLAMARERDLPNWLAAVHPRFSVPYRAELVLAMVVCVAVAAVDLRGAIGFSSFGVLLYYLIANAAAITQPPNQRRYPRALPVLGIVGCVALVVTLPPTSIAVGVGVLAVGAGYRRIARRVRRARRP